MSTRLRERAMSLTEFTLFLSVTFIVSASPGPMMLSCMSNGGRYGMAKSIEGMIGASLGNLFLVILSALGLGLIVSTNDMLFGAIKWLGALYLIYLGVQTIRQPTHSLITTAKTTNKITDKKTNKIHALWLSSFFIAISNPKGLIYFGALFPQFIHYDQPLLWQFTILTLTFLITDLLWMLIYAALGNRIMVWLKTPKHQTLFNTISGLVLIIVGLLVAVTGKH